MERFNRVQHTVDLSSYEWMNEFKNNKEKCQWKSNMDIITLWFALKQDFWKI